MANKEGSRTFLDGNRRADADFRRASRLRRLSQAKSRGESAPAIGFDHCGALALSLPLPAVKLQMEDIMADDSEKDSGPDHRYGLLREALRLVAEGLKLLDALASLLLRVL